MRKSILFLFAVVSAMRLSATATAPEKIIYEDTTYLMHTLPLHPYFADYPDALPEIGDPIKLPDGMAGLIATTGFIPRHYYSTFEIKDGELMVNDIKMYAHKIAEGNLKNYYISVMHLVFPDSAQMQVHANWFTGTLVLPYGDRVEFIPTAFETRYSKYILLNIDKGKLVDEYRLPGTVFDNFKKSEYWQFPWPYLRIDEYLDHLKKTPTPESTKEIIYIDHRKQHESMDREN